MQNTKRLGTIQHRVTTETGKLGKAGASVASALRHAHAASSAEDVLALMRAGQDSPTEDEAQ
eukprot:SAG31_NODE_23427_length_504_cov_1.395062_1_plen_61_part_10